MPNKATGMFYKLQQWVSAGAVRENLSTCDLSLSSLHCMLHLTLTIQSCLIISWNQDLKCYPLNLQCTSWKSSRAIVSFSPIWFLLQPSCTYHPFLVHKIVETVDGRGATRGYCCFTVSYLLWLLSFSYEWIQKKLELWSRRRW